MYERELLMRFIYNLSSRLYYSSLSFRAPCLCPGEASFNHNNGTFFMHEKGHSFTRVKALFMSEDRGTKTPLSNPTHLRTGL